MNLIEEIKKCVTFAEGYNITFDGSGGYIRGVKRICSVGDCCITLETVCAYIMVCGEKLNVSKLIDGDVGLSGKIINVEIKSK